MNSNRARKSRANTPQNERKLTKEEKANIFPVTIAQIKVLAQKANTASEFCLAILPKMKASKGGEEYIQLAMGIKDIFLQLNIITNHCRDLSTNPDKDNFSVFTLKVTKQDNSNPNDWDNWSYDETDEEKVEQEAEEVETLMNRQEFYNYLFTQLNVKCALIYIHKEAMTQLYVKRKATPENWKNAEQKLSTSSFISEINSSSTTEPEKEKEYEKEKHKQPRQ